MPFNSNTFMDNERINVPFVHILYWGYHIGGKIILQSQGLFTLFAILTRQLWFTGASSLTSIEGTFKIMSQGREYHILGHIPIMPCGPTHTFTSMMHACASIIRAVLTVGQMRMSSNMEPHFTKDVIERKLNQGGVDQWHLNDDHITEGIPAFMRPLSAINNNSTYFNGITLEQIAHYPVGNLDSFVFASRTCVSLMSTFKAYFNEHLSQFEDGVIKARISRMQLGFSTLEEAVNTLDITPHNPLTRVPHDVWDVNALSTSFPEVDK